MKRHQKVTSFIAVCSLFIGGALGAACKSKEIKVVNHTHEFDETQWYSDSVSHWYKASCGHNVVQSFAHEYTDETDMICNICGYVRGNTGGGDTNGDDDDCGEEEPDAGDDKPDDETPDTDGDNSGNEEPDVGGDNSGDNEPDVDNDNSGDEPKDEEPDEGDDEPDVEMPDEGENNPSIPDGFIIEKHTDGLEVDLYSTSFFLNREYLSVNISAADISVYLTANGERLCKVPEENYELKLDFCNVSLGAFTGLTEEGDYTLSATLTGAYYEDGTTVESGVFCAATVFRIFNPVTELRLKAGATVQTASPTDKMSAGWVFEGVRSNGETFPVPSSEITCEGLDTLTAGTRRAVISYGGVTGEIEYTITPRPEIIKDVDVSLKDSINTTVEVDYLTVGVDDFNVNVNADGAYSLTDSWLIYAGQLSKDAVLSAKEEPHELIVRVCFEYAVEGENVMKEFERTVFIKVTKTQPPSEPAEPVGDNLIVDGSVMDGLPKEITGQTLASSAAGNIIVVEDKEFTVRVEDCSRTVEGVSFTKAITVEVGDGGFEYSGLRFAIDKAATVRVYIALTDMIGVSIAGMDGENLNILFDDYDCVGEDGAMVEYSLAEGEYCLFALGGTGGKLSVYSMGIFFD